MKKKINNNTSNVGSQKKFRLWIFTLLPSVLKIEKVNTNIFIKMRVFLTISRHYSHFF